MNQVISKRALLTVLVASNLSIGLAVATSERGAESMPAQSNQAQSNSKQNSASQSQNKGQRVSHLMAPAARCQPLIDKSVSVPFTRGEAGHVLVEGLFNAHNEIAVVDTGGIGVGGVVSEKVMTKIEPADKPGGEVAVQGASHSKAMKFTRIKKTGIGDAKSGELNYVISPKAILDGEAEALIGSEFLCSFTAEFNFAESKLSLHPKTDSVDSLIKLPAYQQKEWGEAANLAPIRGALVIDMTINGKPVKAIVDTGARHSIMNWQAASLLGLEKNSPELVVEDKEFGGIHGKSTDKSYRVKLDEVAMAGTQVSLHDMDMRISDMGSFKPLVGDVPAINLGVDFFEGRQLIIDYANRKIAVSN